MAEMHGEWCDRALKIERVCVEAGFSSREHELRERLKPWEDLRSKLKDRMGRVTNTSPQGLAASAVFLTFNRQISPLAFAAAVSSLFLSMMAIFSGTAVAWKVHDMPIWDLKFCAAHHRRAAGFTFALPPTLLIWSALSFVVMILDTVWSRKAPATFALVIFLLRSPGLWGAYALVGSIIVGKNIDTRDQNLDYYFVGEFDRIWNQVMMGYIFIPMVDLQELRTRTAGHDSNNKPAHPPTPIPQPTDAPHGTDTTPSPQVTLPASPSASGPLVDAISMV
ncbi:hypothetical protein JAAARDRAFT_199306 [Jaapia argillacea MUCL 33604]|uniref:Uncharacterized protein n=1 Tax=Jaapia argillacea MUCL 33604 TaxID=933084 RepID=A0A067P912_9AGAM|nr:hypothetical protein JAAARDRAFT_199306 [Jaapia argillacea MUCL 33604]